MLTIIIALVFIVQLCYCGSCGTNCSSCNASNMCTNCVNNTYLYMGSCIAQCTAGYYANTQNQCIACSSACSTCSVDAANCTSCKQSLQLLYQGQCLSQCPAKSVPTYNQTQSYCAPCSTSCLGCSGNPSNCTSCSDTTQSLYLGACVSSCPSGSFSKQSTSTDGTNTTIQVCSNCTTNCLNCKNEKTCSFCQPGYFLSEDQTQCLSKCPDGFSTDVIYRRCYRTSCPDGMFDISQTNQIGVQCSSTCQSGYYIDSTNKKCILCDSSCSQCTGPLSTDCLVCDSSCLTCAGSRFDQCLSCTPDRSLYQKFNQPVGECVCSFDGKTEILEQYCENSDQADGIFRALAGLTITNFVMGVLNSFFSLNSILILRYIDFSQTLSYLGYITIKYPIQLDRILKIYDHFNIGYLLPKPTQFADSVVISSASLQNDPYNSQLAYSGNPLFFVNSDLPFLIINGFSYLIIYLFCIFLILTLRYVVYPLTQSDKILKITKKLPHTLLVNVFILTSQEMITQTFIQFTNVQYMKTYAVSIISTLLASIFTILIFVALIYLIYRTKIKLDFEMEEEAFDARRKYIREVKQQNGIPSHFQLCILIRKIVYSIGVAFLYNYPKAQASLFFIIQVLLLFYFLMKKPFQNSKYQNLAFFLELVFLLFCLIMMIGVFLSGEMLVNAFIAFGAFLIIFQVVICLLGACYFIIMAFKLIRIKEKLEMEQLQKQFEAVKRLEYQDSINKKQQNKLFYGQNNLLVDNENNSPSKLLSNGHIQSADNPFLSNGFTQQFSQAMNNNNHMNNNNNSFLLGQNQNTSYIHTKGNLHNESQILQNQSILETKTIDAQHSPIKGMQLGFLSYSNSGEQEGGIKKQNLRKLLPPINQGSDVKTGSTGGISHILSDLSNTNPSNTFKKSSIILSAVQQTDSQKNSDYIKKRLNSKKNLKSNEDNPEINEVKEGDINFVQNNEEILEMNSYIVGSVPNTSKVQVTARDHENSSYRNQQLANTVSSRSETIVLQQQKNNQHLQLIQSGDENEESEEDHQHHGRQLNQNSDTFKFQKQQPHFMQQYQKPTSENSNSRVKEITILN